MRKFLYIPADYVTEGGFELGKVWAGLLEAYYQNQLSEEEIRFLLKLRMQFTDSPKKNLELWMDRADEVENYFKEHGTLSMPDTTAFSDGASMFLWVHHQKSQYKKGELSLYQIGRLEGMGIRWIQPHKPKPIRNKWESAYILAQNYFEEHGHLLMERSCRLEDGFPLGEWVAEQRDSYIGISAKRLSQEKIQKLEDIGMCWENPARARWNWFLKMLSEYMGSTEQPFPIRKDFKYKNYELGRELLYVLRDYVNQTLSREKIQDMKRIGFQFKKGLFVKNGR